MSAYRQNVTYGSFTFPYTKVEIDQVPVYASDGIQLQGTEYTFTISGHIAAADPATLETTIVNMRRTLARRGLEFKLSSFDLANVETIWFDIGGFIVPGTGQVDDRWGPTPQPLKISRIKGNIAAVYGWSVKCFVKECIDGACNISEPADPIILSITTAFTHRVDIDGFSSRTVTGRLTISSQTVASGTPADSFRNEAIAAIPLPPYFRRMGYEFGQNEAGTELTFSFIDEEFNDVLPDPITGGDVNFSINVDQTGAIVTYDLSGYLSAPYTVSKTTIFDRLFTIVSDRFPMDKEGFVPTERSLSVNLLKNRVDFHFSATCAMGLVNGLPDFKGGILDTLAKPLTADGIAHVAGPYGGDADGNSGIIANLPDYTADACGNVLAQADEEQTPDNSRIDVGNPGDIPNEGPITGDPQSNISAGHRAAPFIAYHEELHYQLDNGLTIYTPKSVTPTAKPFAVRSRIPTVVVIQAGYYVRYAKDATASEGVPPPLYVEIDNPGGTRARLLTANINPSVPEPVGDGQYNKYTCHWEYVMQFVQPINGVADADISYPIDARRVMPEEQDFDHVNPPELVDTIPPAS